MSSCNTTDTGVHLTQLITECVKVSIHALKLCHDHLKSHTTHRRRRSKYGWSGRCRRRDRLGPWPLQSKLGFALLNGHCVYGTHDREVCRLKIEDRRMAKNPRDSRRENKLIMGRCIFIDIYRKSIKWEGKYIIGPSSRDNKNRARGLVMKL